MSIWNSENQYKTKQIGVQIFFSSPGAVAEDIWEGAACYFPFLLRKDSLKKMLEIYVQI